MCEVKEQAIKNQLTMQDPNLDPDESANSDTLLYLVTVEQVEHDERAWVETIRSSIKPLVDDERDEARRLLETYGAQGVEPIADLRQSLDARKAIKDGSGSEVTTSEKSTGVAKAAAKRQSGKAKRPKADDSNVFDPKKIKLGSEFRA